MSINKPFAVSLFSGAGGCDIGLEDAGFHLAAATDADQSCVETLRVNAERRVHLPGDPSRTYLEGTKLLQAPVEDVSCSDLWRLSREPDLLVGGPPCQPFSSAGRQESVSDSRGRLFEDFVRIAKELQPKLILFENVRGLVTARGPSGTPGEALVMVKDAFESIGYASSFSLLNSADFGLPQRRVRLFMMASRVGPPPTFPIPTHSREPGPDLFNPTEAWVSLGDFLQDQPDPDGDELILPAPALAAKLAALPDGSGLKSMGAAEPTRPGGHWGYKQGTFIADQRLPARTVTASSSQDWIRDRSLRLRRLTVKEVAGLQGFPATWSFVGGRARQYQQIGNAVPPPVARALGEAMLRALSSPEAGPAESVPFPDYMAAAIEYTRKEDLRNGSARVRSPHYAGQS